MPQTTSTLSENEEWIEVDEESLCFKTEGGITRYVEMEERENGDM